jgi:hypothetical protein
MAATHLISKHVGDQATPQQRAAFMQSVVARADTHIYVAI